MSGTADTAKAVVSPATGRRAQGNQTKRTILEAAIDLYAESGFRGTGLVAIGDRAGVAHVTVLYHFGSSRELLLAVLHERERRFQEATAHAWVEPGLAAVHNLPEVARFNVAEPKLAKVFTVLQAENLDPGHEANEFFRQRRQEVRDLLRANLRFAQEQGDVRTDVDVDRKTDEILAFTTGAQIQHWLDPDGVDLVALYEHYRDGLVGEITRGMRSRSPHEH